MSRVGSKIKLIRNQKGMSQKQLAKKLGVAEKFINEVECGRKVLSESLLGRVSKILGEDLNDVTMSFEEQIQSYEEKVTEIPFKKKEVNQVWRDAFSSVLREVPVYDYSMKNILFRKPMPVLSNKIEGYHQDKVFFVQVEDDDMSGFRMLKGDIAFCHMCHEFDGNNIYLLQHDGEIVIRQIRKLDSQKLLLVSNKGSLRTETVVIKQIKILAKVTKVEIKL